MIRAPEGEEARLAATLAHAAGLPFYAERWRGLEAQVLSPADLHLLPLLDKAVAAGAQETLRAPGFQVGLGVFSSGTSRDGRPLRVLREEPARDPLRPAWEGPVHTIRVYSPRHGARGPDAPGERSLPATLHASLIDLLADVLAEHRPRDLVIPLSTLKWVTVALEERGQSPARFGLELIGCTGYAVTRAARRWLEPAWRAPLIDNWSMSELAGHAHPCRACARWHWQGAPTWFELINGGGSAQAFGELVATTLLPHGAAMPLIRYRTGDLVELGPPCRAWGGRRGMRFRGRTALSLLDGGRPLALSADLFELGEGLPEVALVPHPAELLGLVPPSDLGVPKVGVRAEPGGGQVDVELRFDPRRHPRRAEEIRAVFRGVVREPVAIRLHRPGTLDLDRLARKL